MAASLLTRVAARIPRGEAGIWRAILSIDASGPWTIADVDWQGNTHKGTVSEYCKRLRLGGYIVQVGERAHPKPWFAPAALFRVEKPVAVAPQLRADGSLRPEPDIEKIWRVVKMSRDFTAREVVAALDEDGDAPLLQTVRVYLMRLARVGILSRTDGGRKAGKAGGGTVEGRYRLARNIGAFAPKVLDSKVIFDPNAETIVDVLVVGEDTP